MGPEVISNRALQGGKGGRSVTVCIVCVCPLSTHVSPLLIGGREVEGSRSCALLLLPFQADFGLVRACVPPSAHDFLTADPFRSLLRPLPVPLVDSGGRHFAHFTACLLLCGEGIARLDASCQHPDDGSCVAAADCQMNAFCIIRDPQH